MNHGLRESFRAGCWVAGVTAGLEAGCFALFRWGGAGYREAMLAGLGFACLWTALAGPGLGAGGKGTLDAVFRGGAVADGGGVALLVFWLFGLGEPAGLGLGAALAGYVVLVAVALTGVAAVCLGRSAVARCGLGVAAGLCGAVALASPVWGNAVLDRLEGPAAVEAATWLLRVNPFVAVASTGVERTGFVWHGWGQMYDWTYLGEYILPRSVAWWQTALLWGGLGVLLALAGLVRHRLGRADHRK